MQLMCLWLLPSLRVWQQLQLQMRRSFYFIVTQSCIYIMPHTQLNAFEHLFKTSCQVKKEVWEEINTTQVQHTQLDDLCKSYMLPHCLQNLYPVASPLWSLVSSFYTLAFLCMLGCRSFYIYACTTGLEPPISYIQLPLVLCLHPKWKKIIQDQEES